MSDPTFDPPPEEEVPSAEEVPVDEGEKYDGGPIPETSTPDGEE